MLIWAVGIPVAAYLVLLAYLYVNQRNLLYRPTISRPPLGDLSELGVREIEAVTADGLSLRSWYLPPPSGDRPVVAYLHGNGGNIGHRASRLVRFASEGCGVLLVGYRGYGGNPGNPTEDGFYQDARAALDFLARERISGTRIVLYGESLGSAVAVAMAAEREIAALVLESPFTSIAAVAQHHYPYAPAAFLIWDRFDALSRIGAVRAPLLMLQGGRDRVVPPQLGDALFEAAGASKERWFAPDGSHEDLAAFGALDAAIAFIERHAAESRLNRR